MTDTECVCACVHVCVCLSAFRFHFSARWYVCTVTKIMTIVYSFL